MPHIDHLAKLPPGDQAAIEQPLDEFSRGRGFTWQPQPLALALRDDCGSLLLPSKPAELFMFRDIGDTHV